MKGTLLSLASEIETFRNKHGNDLLPGSLAFRDRDTAPTPEHSNLLPSVWSRASLFVAATEQNHLAFVRTLEDPILSIACWNCVRSMLEPCALAVWILDPDISVQCRIGRLLAIRYKEADQFMKNLRSGDPYHADIQTIKDRIRRGERDARKMGYCRVKNKRGRRIGLGQKMPSATALIESTIKKERLYRLFSAAAHGHFGVLRDLGFAPVETENDPGFAKDIFGEPVTWYRSQVNMERLNYLGVISALVLSIAVWNQCRYAGWDGEYLARMLDGLFNQLRPKLPQSERFWKRSF